MSRSFHPDSSIAFLSMLGGTEADFRRLSEPERELLLAKLLHTLRSREREMVSRYHGLRDGRRQTLEEIGRLFRRTRQRIQQIHDGALEELGRALPGLWHLLSRSPESTTRPILSSSWELPWHHVFTPSARLKSCLDHDYPHLTRLRDLTLICGNDLLSRKNLGLTTLREFYAAMHSQGLCLRHASSPPSWQGTSTLSVDQVRDLLTAGATAIVQVERLGERWRVSVGSSFSMTVESRETADRLAHAIRNDLAASIRDAVSRELSAGEETIGGRKG